MTGIVGDNLNRSSGLIKEASGGINWDTTPKTSNFNSESGRGYFVDTSSAAVTATLPATAETGDIVAFKDYTATFNTNNLTIARNGHKIQGNAENSTISTIRASVVLVYVDSTKGWLFSVESNVADLEQKLYVTASGGTITTSGNYKIHTFDSSFDDYVQSPVASSGGLSVPAQAYPITIGAGGTGAPNGAQASASTGGAASIFSTVTSTGGGGGAGDNGGQGGSPGGSCGPGAGKGGAGGSGGGGSNGSLSTGGATIAVPAPSGGGETAQGNAGESHPHPGGGGGGGAGEAGGTDGDSDGGDGVTSRINASPVTRAGGGGGGGFEGNGSPGGDGGGGNGGNHPNGNGTAGSANTGGGGGGGSGAPGGNDGDGANGGSGLIIIRYKYQN